jgi:regulation of enolase protein 1 (concanavalin A-like superfamily)
MTALDPDRLAGPLRAGARTDWFVDPATGAATASAPLRLVAAPDGDFQLRAHVRAELRATFDAGAVFVHSGPDRWAKLALERSPAGVDTIVTVVTRGVSDDANGVAVPTPGEAWLRVSRIGAVYAFHHSADGVRWSLARLFTLGPIGDHRVGVSSQSPTGAGLTASFSDVVLTPTTLADPRDGT